MGASFGSGDNKRNVDLNLVPMIDLMSCMTAFLLVTAVWQQMAAVDTEGAAKGVAGVRGEDNPKVSILLDLDRLAVTGAGEPVTLTPRDWAALGATLAHADPSAEVQIGAADGVAYQDLVTALTTAHASGLTHVQVVDPRSF